MRKKKNKKKLILAAVLTVLLAGNVVVPKKAHAGAWGEAMGAELVHEAWVMAREAFLNAMLAALKKEANNMISDKMRQVLSGSGSDSLVITDYEHFIYDNSEQEAKKYAYDFFRDLESGTSQETTQMYRDLEEAMLGRKEDTKNLSTIDEYVDGGIKNVFDQNKGGGIQAFASTITNPYNSPIGTYMEVSGQMEAKQQIEQKKAEVEAVAGKGFKSKREDSNLINLPGSVLAEMAAKSKTNYFDMVNSATSIPEVVGTLAASVVSETIKEGVAEVAKPMDEKIQSYNEQIEGGTGEIQRRIYNGLEFE
ncbi:MAG: hypothetical protein U5L10_00235 [Candidatus Moranbacteria bacterium]|nr:hypothetical protein [Candidatus Moranbacteria bacterium]